MKVMHVDNLHRGNLLVIKRREDGLGAEPRHGKATPVVGIASCQDLGKRQKAAAPAVFFKRDLPCGRGGEKGSAKAAGIEADTGEDLVGVDVGEEADCGHAAEDHGWDDVGHIDWRRGLLSVALGEVVDAGSDSGEAGAGAGTRLPRLGVDLSGRHFE